MRKGLTPLTGEKILIALQLQEAIDHINTALKTRKAALTLDYTRSDMVQLLIETPDHKPMYWLVANPRNKGHCAGAWPDNLELAVICRDILERLQRLNAYIAIGVVKNKQQQSIAKLQIFFKESKRMAITLCEAKRGTKNRTNIFEPPKAFQ